MTEHTDFNVKKLSAAIPFHSSAWVKGLTVFCYTSITLEHYRDTGNRQLVPYLMVDPIHMNSFSIPIVNEFSLVVGTSQCVSAALGLVI